MDQLLRRVSCPEEVLSLVATRGFAHPEQWQAQLFALIQRRANILVYSSLSDEIIRAAHLKPCRDIAATVAETLGKIGGQARVAVLPQGPLTIPYLKPKSN